MADQPSMSSTNFRFCSYVLTFKGAEKSHSMVHSRGTTLCLGLSVLGGWRVYW